jgi:excisionase family DNA binding protein
MDQSTKDLATTEPELLDARAVARLLDCSPRTVYRLADSGRIPSPVRLGGLVRWSRRGLEGWIEEGCPKCDGRR